MATDKKKKATVLPMRGHGHNGRPSLGDSVPYQIRIGRSLLADAEQMSRLLDIDNVSAYIRMALSNQIARDKSQRSGRSLRAAKQALAKLMQALDEVMDG